jgi:hypothetical protein
MDCVRHMSGRFSQDFYFHFVAGKAALQFIKMFTYATLNALNFQNTYLGKFNWNQ